MIEYDKLIYFKKMRRTVTWWRVILMVVLPFHVLTGPSLLHAADALGESRSISLDDAVRIGIERSRSLEIARLDKIWQGRKSGRHGRRYCPRLPPLLLIPAR